MPFQATPFQLVFVAILGGALCIILLVWRPSLTIRWKFGGFLRRQTVDDAMVPIWRTNKDGRVLWSNRAYRALWSEGDPPTETGRITTTSNGAVRYFEINQQNGLSLALPIDRLVQTENDLRDMVQAMAKTFAQLSTGLAVFDKHRNLQSFNPALSDLTALSPEFLSRRPSLAAVLDRMRDRNMIPEPANWKDWRRQIAAMERAAAHGHFEEVWSLPGGQTYRVTGRPHPDGCLALMIDDISSEIIRSRRYRSELELCQTVVDTMDDAIAVFASTGQLVMTNAAYGQLWGHNPGGNLATTSIRSMAEHWRKLCPPTTLWSEAEEYLTSLEQRDPWRTEVRLLDGRLIECNFFPLSGGATLVRFHGSRRNAAPLAIAKA